MTEQMTFEDLGLLRNRDHYVYLVYGDGGQLIYLGCTSRIGQRYALHESHSPWWHLMVATHELGPYNRREALDLEQELIWTLGPLCNRLQRGDFKQFGLRASEHMGDGRYTNAEQREIRRRNLTDVPAERRARDLDAAREALNRVADVLDPDGSLLARFVASDSDTIQERRGVA